MTGPNDEILYEGISRDKAIQSYTNVRGARHATTMTHLERVIGAAKREKAIEKFWTLLPDSVREAAHFVLSKVPIPDPIFKRAYEEYPTVFVQVSGSYI